MSSAPAAFAIADEPATVIARPRATRSDAVVIGPGTRIGAWRVEGELGRGGMATVYAVVHTRFGKRAALKLAHADIVDARGAAHADDRDATASNEAQMTTAAFLREARIVHAVDHRGVTDVFATGRYHGRPYLVMNRVAGRPLSAIARDLARPDALAILDELCAVLAAAHAHGVVHRDLKPSNVLVSDTDGARLIDWGVAHIIGEPDPLAGMIAGTLSYVAPEQIRGEEITTATDIYSLGVLAHELVVGEPPFAAAAGGEIELLRKHLRAEPPSPRVRWPACPDALVQLLAAMLAKVPCDRPTIADVRTQLAAIRDELLAPAPAPAVPRWRRWLPWTRTRAA